MTDKFLPNYYKKIIIPIAVLLILCLTFSNPLAGFFKLEENIFNWILKDLILICFTALIFTQEKMESPRIQKLRIKKLVEALGFGVIVVIYDSLSAIFYWSESFEMKSSYEFLILIISYYHIIFFISKNIKQVKRA